MLETAGQKLQVGGLGSLHRYAGILLEEFGTQVDNGEILDVENTDAAKTTAWRLVQTTVKMRDVFAAALDANQQARERIAAACGIAADRVTALLKLETDTARFEGVVKEVSPGREQDLKFNRCKVLLGTGYNASFSVEVRKRGAMWCCTLPLTKVDEAALAQAFNPENNPNPDNKHFPWTQTRMQWFDADGNEISEEQGDPMVGSRCEFTRVLRIQTTDGKYIRITWNGKHMNPTDVRDTGDFAVEDRLTPELETDAEMVIHFLREQGILGKIEHTGTMPSENFSGLEEGFFCTIENAQADQTTLLVRAPGSQVIRIFRCGFISEALPNSLSQHFTQFGGLAPATVASLFAKIHTAEDAASRGKQV